MGESVKKNRSDIRTFQKNPEKAKLLEIEDKYEIVYVLFFLLGLIHVLPWSFFTTATDYWMYKFRNTSFEEIDSKHRTTLQKEFSPCTMISLQLSTISFLYLTLFFGHKFSLKIKTFVPLISNLVCFIIAAIFILIDTDDWQMELFVITMILVVGINGTGAVFGMSLYSILSNFPKEYLGAYLKGQGLATIFTAILQLFSLGVGMSTKISALLYFWMAIVVIAFATFLMIGVVKFNKFYRHNLREYKEIKQEMMSYKEILSILKKLWPVMGMITFLLLSLSPVHPSITSLVVSEGEGEGEGEWNDVYFVPTITFMVFAICDYIGRFVAVASSKFDVNPIYFLIFTILRLVFVPLLMLCNAQPRNHLPVIFPHDYQYIILMVIFALTAGFGITTASIIVPKLVPPEQLEKGLHLQMVISGTGMGLLCFLGIISVNFI